VLVGVGLVGGVSLGGVSRKGDRVIIHCNSKVFL
jgi:hypothetical protein